MGCGNDAGKDNDNRIIQPSNGLQINSEKSTFKLGAKPVYLSYRNFNQKYE